MSVLSFLALKDDQLHLPGIGGDPQDQARSRVSIDLLGQGKIRLERQQSDGKAVKHIMPLEELAKFALNRSSSTSSDGRLDQFSPRSPVPLVQEQKVELAAFMRSSPLLSPPSSPVSPKKLASPSIPTSLVPPPRRRGSSTAPSSDARSTPHPFGTGGPTHPRRTPTHRELPDTPTSPSRSEPKDRSSTLQSGSSPDLSFRSAWSEEREIERKRLEEWLASKPRRAGRGGMEKLSRTDVRGAQGI